MGTRADFYIGRGPDAEWLGSIAYDGYRFEENLDHPIHKCNNEREFSLVVATILAETENSTTPDMGWPWPWADSSTTDYAYYLYDGKVLWDERKDWPDMTAVAKPTLGPRSGLLCVVG